MDMLTKKLALAALLALAAATGSAQLHPGDARWVSYRELWFDFDSSRLDATDASKVAEVASYMKSNPTHRVGLDGVTEGENRDLNVQRIATLRQALIKAGVPANKIHTGAFGDPRFARSRRVEVLVDRRE